MTVWKNNSSSWSSIRHQSNTIWHEKNGKQKQKEPSKDSMTLSCFSYLAAEDQFMRHNHHHDSRIMIFSNDYNHYLHSVHHVEMIHCIFRVHAWMTKLIKDDNDKATHLPPGHSCHHTSLKNTFNITTTMSRDNVSGYIIRQTIHSSQCPFLWQ